MATDEEEEISLEIACLADIAQEITSLAAQLSDITARLQALELAATTNTTRRQPRVAARAEPVPATPIPEPPSRTARQYPGPRHFSHFPDGYPTVGQWVYITGTIDAIRITEADRVGRVTRYGKGKTVRVKTLNQRVTWRPPSTLRPATKTEIDRAVQTVTHHK